MILRRITSKSFKNNDIGGEEMKRPQMVIFDYGQTLINEVSFNPLIGTQEVLNRASYNPNGISAEEIQSLANQLNIYQHINLSLLIAPKTQ